MSVDAIFAFVRAHFFQVLTVGALFLWFFLIPYGVALLSLVRKIFLAIFTVGSFYYYKEIVNPLILALDKANFDDWIRRVWAEYKGTDWVDGFLWGIAICIYLGVIANLWIKEKEISKGVVNPYKPAGT